jgi:hypothetical protein
VIASTSGLRHPDFVWNELLLGGIAAARRGAVHSPVRSACRSCQKHRGQVACEYSISDIAPASGRGRSPANGCLRFHPELEERECGRTLSLGVPLAPPSLRIHIRQTNAAPRA